MKIFNAGQLKKWDLHTQNEQGISSGNLMERAARACSDWLIKNGFIHFHMRMFCGKGNNGGDGLALASMLIENNIKTSVYILESGKEGTPEFQEKLQSLHKLTADIHFMQSPEFFPQLGANDVIVDAIFGSGLSRPLEGVSAKLVEFLNKTNNKTIAIDISSGLFTDKSSKGCIAITATHTLSFQNYKAAFLFAENGRYTGELHLLNIGLSPFFETAESVPWEIPELDMLRQIIKPRDKFAHKGDFGHAALVVGSLGMIGAATLAAKACLAAGTGKLTCHIPSCGYEIIQSAVPEAMCRIAGKKYPEEFENNAYSAIGIGPGISTQKQTAGLIEKILTTHPPSLLLDADALNCLAADKKLLQKLPVRTIITPHPKEFDRIFGTSDNDFSRLELAITKAAELKIYIVLKGHHTAVITPAGKVYFNNTGNAGMAKAGMGDVLTGIITGLLAQNYPLPEAAILGVYLHGTAGDIAAERFSMEAMQAGDLVACLGAAWKIL